MKHTLLLTAILSVLCGCATIPQDARESFNADWLFALNTEQSDPFAVDLDDSAWRPLTLPHDWSIEGDFSSENLSGTGGGFLPGGMGWYRKHFTLTQPTEPERVYVDFEGVYMDATVYVNGQLVGNRPYGYISFSYDITPYIKYGQDNVIAVSADNTLLPDSRWYSGCGIYRNVYLRRQNPIHIAQWGQFVQPYEVSSEGAKLRVETTIENTSGDKANVSVRTRVFDPRGRVVAKSENPAASKPSISAAGETPEEKIECVQEFSLSSPVLWDVDSPKLYTVATEVLKDGKVIDTQVNKTGFRYTCFDAEKGFSLNGKSMKLNGVCLHHDAGALGTAVNHRAIERQLQIMKAMGVNAIRCSHNPPAPELLQLCDEMGFLVMDEAFDMWRKRKTKYDYARYFNEWHEKDLTDFVLRDRNHPSIIMWSIGNEVLEQWTDASADTLSLEQANLILNFGHKENEAAENGDFSVNSLLALKLSNMVRALDPRPITSGCNEPRPMNHLFKGGVLDIIGYNYHNSDFKDVPVNFPGMPFLVSESVSGLSTRGYYRMPSDSLYIWPDRWDKPFYDESLSCSAYDNCHVPWGNTQEETLKIVQDNDFIMGQFIWTGFDYIGEPTPYPWPARSSFFGLVDLAGFPKDVYYLYQSQWRQDLKVLHLFPHWNWTEGQAIDMWAYYNNADEVELYINGVSKGLGTLSPEGYHVSWRVTFEPGEVEAVSRKDGKEVARTTIRTASDPARVILQPDRTIIGADGKDLCYVTVTVVDKDGNLCPWADNDICFAVKGSGFNAGVDNGSPISSERFKADHRKAFYGKALLIVQNDGTAGPIEISATSESLGSAALTIKAR